MSTNDVLVCADCDIWSLYCKMSLMVLQKSCSNTLSPQDGAPCFDSNWTILAGPSHSHAGVFIYWLIGPPESQQVGFDWQLSPLAFRLQPTSRWEAVWAHGARLWAHGARLFTFVSFDKIQHMTSAGSLVVAVLDAFKENTLANRDSRANSTKTPKLKVNGFIMFHLTFKKALYFVNTVVPS